MANVGRAVVIALLVGIALSAALLTFMLLSLLGRYSKDLNEVIACWQYITAAIVVAALCVRLAIEVHYSSA